MEVFVNITALPLHLLLQLDRPGKVSMDDPPFLEILHGIGNLAGVAVEQADAHLSPLGHQVLMEATQWSQLLDLWSTSGDKYTECFVHCVPEEGPSGPKRCRMMIVVCIEDC